MPKQLTGTAAKVTSPDGSSSRAKAQVVAESVKQHYLALRHHAGECSSCKRCERRCPFHVGIAKRMKAAAELFGR